MPGVIDQSKVQRDIADIGKTVNEDTVVSPRSGLKYDSLPRLVRVLSENGMFKPFSKEAELLTYVPIIVPSAAKALDTKNVWIFEKRNGDSFAKWYDTGMSEIDQAKELIFVKNSINLIDFKSGSDGGGKPISTNKIFKSDSLALVKDSKVGIMRVIGSNYYGGLSFSYDNEHFDYPKFYFENELEFEVKDYKYVRFYFQRVDGQDIEPSDLLTQKILFKIYNYDINLDEASLFKFKDVFSEFSINNSDFILIDSNLVAESKVFEFKSGTKIKIRKPPSSPAIYWAYSVSSVNSKFIRGVWKSETNDEITISSDANFIKFYLKYEDNSEITFAQLSTFNFKASADILQYDYDNYINSSEHIVKNALEITTNDFEMGSDFKGLHDPSQTEAKTSSIYCLKPGKRVRIFYPNSQGKYWYSYSVGKSPLHMSTRLAPQGGDVEFIVDANQPYYRFYAISKSGAKFSLNDLVNDGLGFEIIASDGTATLSEIALLSRSINQSSLLLDTNNNFRTPTRAEGGVISFIDDDGRSGFWNELYPVIKQKQIPFGVAISPALLGDWQHMTENQIMELSNDTALIELMSHTWSHRALGDMIDEERIKFEIYSTKQWFEQRAIQADGFVYPNGSDNLLTQRIASLYYKSSYDFAENTTVSFETIRNYSIKRAPLPVSVGSAPDLSLIKSLIDKAKNDNEWLIIATHSGNDDYPIGSWWDHTYSVKAIVDLYEYATLLGCKILKPRDGFQIFGNMMENDAGFRITAEGKIING